MPKCAAWADGRWRPTCPSRGANRAIAAELFIGLATLEANFARAHRKLGITSRQLLRARLGEGEPRVEVGQT